jgi:hypothetical protein
MVGHGPGRIDRGHSRQDKSQKSTWIIYTLIIAQRSDQPAHPPTRGAAASIKPPTPVTRGPLILTARCASVRSMPSSRTAELIPPWFPLPSVLPRDETGATCAGLFFSSVSLIHSVICSERSSFVRSARCRFSLISRLGHARSLSRPMSGAASSGSGACHRA